MSFYADHNENGTLALPLTPSLYLPPFHGVGLTNLNYGKTKKIKALLFSMSVYSFPFEIDAGLAITVVVFGRSFSLSALRVQGQRDVVCFKALYG